jgi:hypothetical protein
MRRRAEASARRLLRVLFLRVATLSSAAGIERNVLLRSMMPCCGGEAGDWRPLNRRQRAARFIVGAVLLLLVFLLPWSSALSAIGIVTAAIIGWFGVTHGLAALMAYPGCPELGAVPSLLLHRDVKIGCGPWRWLDERLRRTVCR